MSISPDHQISQSDTNLIFKSSDGKTFSVGSAVANLSSVWKDMLQVGEVDKTADPISLMEDEEQLLQFFGVLASFNDTFQAPEEMQDLDLGGLSRLLGLADKYGARVVGLLVEREVMRRDSERKLFDEQHDSGDVMSLFVFAQRFELFELLEMSAKLSLNISNLVKAQPDSLNGFIDRKRHLLPLILFRERWESIKGCILASQESFFISRTALNSSKYLTLSSIKNSGLQPLSGNCPDCGHWLQSQAYPLHTNKCRFSSQIKPEGLAILLVDAFEQLRFREPSRTSEEGAGEE